jgi:hypothetical protein
MINNFSKFNESASEKITITMDDVRKMKHNLGYRSNTDDSFLQNYSWKEDQILIAMPGYGNPEMWDGKEVKIMDLYSQGKYMSELGYAISIDGKIEYLIGIYEPHGCSLNAKRGCVTAHGHEQIIKVWLDDGEFEETHTR